MGATAMRDGLANVQNMTGKGRVLAKNTWRYTTADGVTHIRLHHTDIVELLPKGKVRLSSGGWKTMTTKARIEAFSGYSIHSDRNGVWHVTKDGQSAPFFDGMVLPDAFKMPPAKAARLIARQVQMKARIKAIVAKAIQPRKPVPMPEMGDCWLCMAETSKLGERVQMDGYDWARAARPGMDSSHIESHIREGYIHGTLIRNAYTDAGKSDSLYAYHAQGIMRGDTYALKDMRRIVGAYLKRRMGLTAR